MFSKSTQNINKLVLKHIKTHSVPKESIPQICVITSNMSLPFSGHRNDHIFHFVVYKQLTGGHH